MFRTAMLALVLLATPALADNTDHKQMHMTGIGKVTVSPDIGYITLGVVNRSPLCEQALTGNTNAMSRVHVRLKALGIKEKEIQTIEFSIQEESASSQRC